MKIALFPGKFQPPHLGHVQSLMSIHDDYDKIIICVTEDLPNVIPVSEVVLIFKDIFRHLKKYEVISISGVLVNSTSLSHLPYFDVLVSGNQKVISHVSSFSKDTRFLERSIGIGYSGTEIRTLFNENHE